MGNQATGQDIILAIVENMARSLEPLHYTVLAPTVYHVSLHPEDHERLEGIFPEIIDQAKRALDDELDALSKAARPPRFFRRFVKKKPALQRPKEGWNIAFHKDADDDLQHGDVLVDSQLTLPPRQEYGVGHRTKRILTHRTSGGMKTLPPVYEEDDVLIPPEGRSTAERAYARITYTDTTGPHVYLMSKDEIAIGRGGLSYYVHVQLTTDAPVSREHLRIRRDAGTGQFFIKDLSKYGTSVNGKKIKSSIGDDQPDLDIWVPLPSTARIGLAEVVVLDFEAVHER
jgi:hypothetical protein